MDATPEDRAPREIDSPAGSRAAPPRPRILTDRAGTEPTDIVQSRDTVQAADDRERVVTKIEQGEQASQAAHGIDDRLRRPCQQRLLTGVGVEAQEPSDGGNGIGRRIEPGPAGNGALPGGARRRRRDTEGTEWRREASAASRAAPIVSRRARRSVLTPSGSGGNGLVDALSTPAPARAEPRCRRGRGVRKALDWDAVAWPVDRPRAWAL